MSQPDIQEIAVPVDEVAEPSSNNDKFTSSKDMGSEKADENTQVLKIHAILESIRNVAREIMQKMIPIMEVLQDDENDLVDEVVYCCPQAKPEQVVGFLRNETINTLADAEKVNEEIPIFSKALPTDKVCEKKTPFMAAVWHGDTYGEAEMEGLQQLLQDLYNTLSNITEDYIVKQAKAHFCKV